MRERLGPILSGTKPDRLGFAMTLSLYGASLTRCPLAQYFTDPSRYVEGQIVTQERIELMPGVARTVGVNCCELLLGKEAYKSLIREGVFFLLPEWTGRWKEVFTQELGLSQENAENFMQEMHRRLVYLDTGIVPIPLEKIHEVSHYCGLPYELMPVSCDHLQTQIQNAMNRLSGDIP
ncbi:MAG: DUF1638 domain-containing protein [Methanobacteriota archaeon]